MISVLNPKDNPVPGLPWGIYMLEPTGSILDPHVIIGKRRIQLRLATADERAHLASWTMISDSDHMRTEKIRQYNILSQAFNVLVKLGHTQLALGVNDVATDLQNWDNGDGRGPLVPTRNLDEEPNN